MVHSYPVDTDDPHLLFALTFLVAFDDGAEPHEYCLLRSIETQFDAMLTQLTNGDRDAARNFCAAMVLEFRRKYEYRRLLVLRSYRHNRALLFIPGERGSSSNYTPTR